MMKLKYHFYRKQIFLAFLLTTLVVLLAVSPAAAQEDEYRIVMRRNFGYSAGSQVRGDFTISLSGPEEKVASVTFLIDGQEMATVSAAPFHYRFNTSTYSDGVHELSARVTLRDGSVLITTPRRFDFVSSEAQSAMMVKILLPLLGLTLLLSFFGGGLSFLSGRKKIGAAAPGSERQYGTWGGSICPKCKRPTPLHFGGINLVGGKLDRCENCGKWSLLRRYPLDELRAAERAELELEAATVGQAEKSEEDKLREMLERSKYSE